MVVLYFGLGVLAVLAFLSMRRGLRFRINLFPKARTKLLERDLAILISRARAELPAHQLSALTSELQEVKDVEEYMLSQGVDRSEARNAILEGAIQSVANHLALNELFPE